MSEIGVCKCSFCEYSGRCNGYDVCYKPGNSNCPRSAITAYSDYLSEKNNPTKKSQVDTDEIVQKVLEKLLEKM